MKFKIILLSFVAFVLTISSCSEDGTKENTKVQPHGKPIVQVAKAKKSDIHAVLNFSGKLTADKAINIAPELSMRILSIFVEEGDKVTKGQVLAKLDTTKLEQARVQYEDAKRNYQRMRALKESEFVEEQKFEQVKTVFETAKLNYEYIGKIQLSEHLSPASLLARQKGWRILFLHVTRSFREPISV